MSYSSPIEESGFYSLPQEEVNEKCYKLPISLFYKMDHERRGLFIIINNSSFIESMGLPKREGADADNNNLKSIFEDLKFEVILHKDQTVQNMRDIITEASKRDYSDADCFGMAILSHGDSGGSIYGTDGIIKFESLIESISKNRVKSLIGKPKLFFIQACRGQEYDDGVEIQWNSPGFEEDAMISKEEAMKTPAEADFLYCYSTAPGYVSFRNKKNGSWFVQALKSVFELHGNTLELLHLLTIVSHEVATKMESKSDKNSQNKKKQIPTFNSMLTKFVQF